MISRYESGTSMRGLNGTYKPAHTVRGGAVGLKNMQLVSLMDAILAAMCLTYPAYPTSSKSLRVATLSPDPCHKCLA